MSFFDFLRSKPRPEQSFSPGVTLAELLAQATQDPAYIPEFYRRLLLEPLVVITAYDPAVTSETISVADGSTALNVVTWDDGRIPIFTDSSRIFDKGVIHHQVSFAQMKGRALLETLRGATLLLNPYSDHGKTLLPDEVARILAGTILATGQRLTVQQKTKVLIGKPAVYPTQMTQALARLLSQQPRVKAAYLGWIHDASGSVPPHYIICLDVEGEMQSISKETGFVAQQFLGKDEIIDLVQAGQSSLTAYFERTTPFYER